MIHRIIQLETKADDKFFLLFDNGRLKEIKREDYKIGAFLWHLSPEKRKEYILKVRKAKARYYEINEDGSIFVDTEIHFFWEPEKFETSKDYAIFVRDEVLKMHEQNSSMSEILKLKAIEEEKERVRLSKVAPKRKYKGNLKNIIINKKEVK